MTERTLSRCRILVVEDEYILADELRIELEERGAVVLGPVGTVREAMELVRREPQIDSAILDVNLHGEPVFPVGDLLVESGTPFLFTTVYDAVIIPSRFKGVVRCEKPVSMSRVTSAIGRVIHA